MKGNDVPEGMPSLHIAVIGSGLSAMGAIKALRARGFRPTVIDRGECLDDERLGKLEALAEKQPSDWSPQERQDLSRNSSLKDGSAIPKKQVFGSDYFYGSTNPNAPIKSKGNPPPFSYAMGGLSVGWGAAVLPAQPCDLKDWPVTAEELNFYSAKILAAVPYSAKDDGLSLDFPLLAPPRESLKPSRAERWMLDKLDCASILRQGETVYGQARLLVDAGNGGCRYCGQCMSGCVYNAIYKAGDDIQALHRKNEIDYLPGLFVQRLEEEDGKVVVTTLDPAGSLNRMTFDRVFLAAGAVNSTRIVLESLRLYDRKVRLLSRGGFVIPMLSLRRVPSDWPDCNTQPGLFMGLRGKGLDNWVHVQISMENELLLQKIGIDRGGRGIFTSIKRLLASHVVVLFVNYHSVNAGSYDLWLERENEDAHVGTLRSEQNRSLPPLKVWKTSWMRLLAVFAKVGCFPMFPMARLNSGAYHVGGTLPMRKNPSGPLETDATGRLRAWKQVHVVDTSTFPSVPGTTIGLTTMANAYRIAFETRLF